MRSSPPVLALGLLILGFIGWSFGRPQAESFKGEQAPPAQPTPFLTPTPGPDGRIIYTVLEGDTLWRIAAIAEITLDELMAMNGIQPGDFISPGMQLELGFGGPPEPSTPPPGFNPTPTSIPASPTPVSGTGEICVLFFLDENGNGQMEEMEGPLAEGQVSVVDIDGNLAGEHDTDLTPEGHCFRDLANGPYNVSAAVPADYNPTTGLNVPVSLDPGDIKYLQFGAQPGSVLDGSGDGGTSSRSTVLGLLGVLLLVAAAGLGYYAARSVRGTPPSLR